MSMSPAQKKFMEVIHAGGGKFYLSDFGGITMQQIAGWWRTGDALSRQGILEKVKGSDCFQLKGENTK